MEKKSAQFFATWSWNIEDPQERTGKTEMFEEKIQKKGREQSVNKISEF